MTKVFRFVGITPKRANWIKKLFPLFFIESQLLCAYRLQMLKIIDYLSTIEALNTSVNVRRQAEKVWDVSFRNFGDRCEEVGRSIALRGLNYI